MKTNDAEKEEEILCHYKVEIHLAYHVKKSDSLRVRQKLESNLSRAVTCGLYISNMGDIASLVDSFSDVTLNN